MIELHFDNTAQAAAWNSIEQQAPGGLFPEGLALGHPVLTSAADLLWSAGKGPAANDKDAVYYVIPYQYNDAGEYEDYARAYVLPQYDGWMKEGLLSGYEVLFNRYPVGDP
ncbi:MAG: hypothetical protein JJE34_04330 [Alphaproteobacteria bacterium]|nr:hypothetical protein [Alphaproteobacteria bacterium]